MTCASQVSLPSLELLLAPSSPNTAWDDSDSAPLYVTEDIQLFPDSEQSNNLDGPETIPRQVTITRFASARVLRSGVFGTEDRTGYIAWSSTNLGASLLAKLAPHVRGRKVIELGCGTGLLSATAARLGASLVIPTDGDPGAAAVAVHNARAQLSESDSSTTVCGHQLYWSDTAASDAILASHGPLDLAVAAETFYIFTRGTLDLTIEDMATELLSCVKRVLRPSFCALCFPDHSPTNGPRQLPPAFLVVYHPRIRGMAPSIRRAASNCNLSVSPLSRAHKTGPLPGSGRLVLFTRCDHDLETFIEMSGVVKGGKEEEEDWDEDKETEEGFLSALGGAVDD